MRNFCTGIAELAVVVFDALDWQMPEGMCRKLSPQLEALLDMMVSADDLEEEDEGISIGEEEMFSSLCRKITQSCRRHHSPVSLQSIGGFVPLQVTAAIAAIHVL